MPATSTRLWTPFVLLAATLPALVAQSATVSTEEMQAAGFSRATNKVVLLPDRAGSTNLTLYSPATGLETVALPGLGEQLAVNASGTLAAVRHPNAISVVNLVSRTLVRTFAATPTIFDASKLAISEDWVYLTGTGSFHIPTGTVVPHTFEGVQKARMLPDGSALIACTQSFKLMRIDTSTGPMSGSRTLVLDGGCNGDLLSISGDGTKLYTEYGRVRTIANDPAADLPYLSEIADSYYLSNVYDPGNGKAVMIRSKATSVFDTASMRVLNTYYASGLPLGSFLDTSGNGLFLVTSNRVTRMDLQAASTTCFASFYEDQYNPAIRNVTGSGAVISYQIEAATPDCQYQLTTSANWVEFVESDGGKSGGTGAMRLVVRPNLTGAPRTATLQLGSQSLTLTQAALTRVQMQRISVNVQDAEFNRTNNTLVVVSKAPDELHIYDPATGTTQFVRLSFTPLSVAVQPDGRFAAVGHAGSITLVSLEARAIVQQIRIPYPVRDIVLPGNGYVYAFAPGANWGYYNLSTNTWTVVNSPLTSATATLNAPLKAIYVQGQKWSIANGVPAKVEIPANTACPTTSVSEAGDLRIGCGTIAEASNDPAREGTPVATYSVSLSQRLDHSAAQRAFAGTPGFGALTVVADRTAAPIASIQVPAFDGFSMSLSPFVFWNREGTRIYTVTNGFMPPDLTFTNHVVIGEFALPGACPFTLSQSQVSAPAEGVTGQITIATQPGCSFAPGPLPYWIRASSQTTTSFQYEVLPNETTQIRSHAVTVGSRSILFTQAASTGVVTLSPSSLTFTQGVTSLPVTIQTSRPDLVWTLTNLTPDVILTDSTSNVGTQTITLTVRFNSSNSARTGLVLVNGVRLTVTQAGLNGALTGATPVTLLSTKGDPVLVTVGNSAGAQPDNTLGDSTWIRTEISSPTQVAVSASENLTTRYRTGYFVASGQRYQVTQSPSPQLVYYPVTPCRLADTRLANGPYGGPFVAGGSTRTFQVYAGPCGIDASASAFALNITVVPRNGGPLGYLTVYPAGRERPNISLLNSLDGRIKAAFTVVNAGTPGGGISVFANNDTDVIVDVAGYFAPQTGPGLLFFPVEPCRVTDTRTNNSMLRAGVAQSIEVAGKCGVPASAVALSMNATAIPKTTLGYLQVWPTGQAQPNVSTLNATTGAITANALFAPAGTDGKVDVFANSDADLLLDVSGYFAYPGTPGLAHWYNRVEPCRMSDTRDTRVELSPANAYREIAGAGVCGLPTVATYSLMNVTAIPSGPLGYLTVWAAGDRPPVSTLNAVDGQITSNAAIVEQQGFPGNFRVFGSGFTHVFFDLTGYFARF